MTESKSSAAPLPANVSHPRPLSPHLSIYRWHITMALSIFHRATGVALIAGIVFFVGWIWSVAYCPEAVVHFQDFGASWLGKLFLIGWTFAFMLHFMNGIRHLFWDAVIGLEVAPAKRSGQIVAGGAIILTAFLWYLLLNK
ncbi:MAG: succinate dehydrogenase, cytochrome b556 subunit [Alphaproteobacteria bacterium]|nr:succinate dehydrogenase, cytochrome b556 subunit [Alphaproteobacteria bacterium]